VRQHQDSARTGRQATVEHSTTGSTDHPKSPAIGAAADARPPRRETRFRSPAITTTSDARKPMTRKAKTMPYRRSGH
jgi:hypothetical protein